MELRQPFRKLTALLQVPPELAGDFRRFRRAQLLNFFLILMAFVLLVASVFNWLTVQFYLISIIEAVLSAICFWTYYWFRTRLDMVAAGWIVSSITGLISITLIIYTKGRLDSYALTIIYPLLVYPLHGTQRGSLAYGVFSLIVIGTIAYGWTHWDLVSPISTLFNVSVVLAIGGGIIVYYEITKEEAHLSRWGGEEFALILPNTRLVDAEMVARALIDTVRGHRFKDVGGITVSMGLGEFNDRTNRDDFFRAIDRALYDAKQQGRDRYVIATLTTVLGEQSIELTEHAPTISLLPSLCLYVGEHRALQERGPQRRVINLRKRKGCVRHDQSVETQVSSRASGRLDGIIGADPDENKLRDTAHTKPSLKPCVYECVRHILFDNMFAGQRSEHFLKLHTRLAWPNRRTDGLGNMPDMHQQSAGFAPGSVQSCDVALSHRIVARTSR